jgi:hypothetical protein
VMEGCEAESSAPSAIVQVGCPLADEVDRVDTVQGLAGGLRQVVPAMVQRGWAHEDIARP